MTYIGVKIAKPLSEDSEVQYAKIAEWCTETQAAMIEDLGTYYECVAIPEPTFGELKTAKLEKLEHSFDSRVSGAFTCTQGWPMQFDRSDTLAVEGAIQLLKATGQTAGYLTDANDATHYDVPIETMEAVKIEMLAAYAQCHARKQNLRTQINAAKNEYELDTITIDWPV